MKEAYFNFVNLEKIKREKIEIYKLIRKLNWIEGLRKMIQLRTQNKRPLNKPKQNRPNIIGKSCRQREL